MAASKSEQAVLNYIRELANKMGLRDWTFQIAFEQPDGSESWAAQCSTFPGRRKAVLMFRPDLFEKGADREEARENVVHELLHCHAAPTDHYVRGSRIVDSDEIHELYNSSFKQHMEQLVDDIAVEWAESFELPPVLK